MFDVNNSYADTKEIAGNLSKTIKFFSNSVIYQSISLTCIASVQYCMFYCFYIHM